MTEQLGKMTDEALVPVERRYQVKIGLWAEGRSDKIAVEKKPNTPEGPIARGGDDCACGIFAAADNPEGILCFVADLDGVSQGKRGDEASIVAARSIYKDAGQFLQRTGKPLDRDAVGVGIGMAIGLANQQVIARRNELMRMPGHGGLNENVMATTLSAFALQESEGSLYLHCWNTGDSTVIVYVQTEDGREIMYPVTIPQDFIGRSLARDEGFIDEYTSPELQLRIQDPQKKMNADKLQQIYRERVDGFVSNAGEAGKDILNQLVDSLGFKERAVVDYTRVQLPHLGEDFKGSRVKRLKVGAMSDGIENYSSYEEQLAAFRQTGADGAVGALLGLGRNVDADDRSAAVAEVVRIPERAAAEVDLTLTEKLFVAMLEDLVGWEEAAGVINSGKLQKEFENMRSQLGRLPAGGRFRAKVMETVMGQLGTEGEKLKKARKTDEQIFEEWLKQVFTPLYRRAGKG